MAGAGLEGRVLRSIFVVKQKALRADDQYVMEEI